MATEPAAEDPAMRSSPATNVRSVEIVSLPPAEDFDDPPLSMFMPPINSPIEAPLRMFTEPPTYPDPDNKLSSPPAPS
jgi:hypothetical protein